MNDYTYAKNKDIEIRVDFVRPETTVDYRFLGEDTWTPAPYQSAEFVQLSAVEVLRTVVDYLESQS